MNIATKLERMLTKPLPIANRPGNTTADVPANNIDTTSETIAIPQVHFDTLHAPFRSSLLSRSSLLVGGLDVHITLPTIE